MPATVPAPMPLSRAWRAPTTINNCGCRTILGERAMPATQRAALAPAASRLRERVAATPIASLGAAFGSANPDAA